MTVFIATHVLERIPPSSRRCRFHVHDLKVDLLPHAFAALRQVAQSRLALRDVLAVEVVGRARSAKLVLGVGDPLVLHLGVLG